MISSTLILFIENINADVAVKIYNKVSKRTNVKKVVMQGSIWGGLMCTNQINTLNKTMKEKETLSYKYRNDPDIGIGVLGMADDTRAVSECGVTSVEKNSVVSSFMKTHKLRKHDEKKCCITCGKCENF